MVSAQRALHVYLRPSERDRLSDWMSEWNERDEHVWRCAQTRSTIANNSHIISSSKPPTNMETTLNWNGPFSEWSVFVLSLSCCCTKQPDDLLYISLSIVICSYIIFNLKPCNEQDKWLAHTENESMAKNQCKKIIVSWKCFECLSLWKITNSHARLSWIMDFAACLMPI